MNVRAISCSGLAALALCCGTQANVLTNPGFEAGLSGWATFGNVFAETITPRTGMGDAKMFGNFSGGFNVSGLFQSFPASPGENWAMDGYFRHNTGDDIPGSGAPNFNWVVLKFEYRDISNAVTGFVESVVLDGTSARDTWLHSNTISLVAPANTTSIWAFMLYLQPQFDGGAVLMDDITLVPAPLTGAPLLALGLGLVSRRRR